MNASTSGPRLLPPWLVKARNMANLTGTRADAMEGHVQENFDVSSRDILKAYNLAARVGSFLPIFLYNEDLVSETFNRLDELGQPVGYTFKV